MSLLVDNVYFNGLIQGRSVLDRTPCRVAAAINVASLSGNINIGGTITAPGDRVLLTAQTDAKNNGIYVTASGAWSRAIDFALGDSVAGINVYITEGTNGGNIYFCSNAIGGDIVGTNNLSFDRIMPTDGSSPYYGKSFTDSSTYISTSADSTKKATFNLSNITTGTTRVMTLPNITGNLLTTNSVVSFSNKTLDDATTYFVNSTDSTKKLQFQASGITASTTRTFTIPDVTNQVLVLDTATQTITAAGYANKQIFTDAKVDSIYNTNGERVIDFNPVENAVNYFEVKSYADTQGRVELIAKGSDTNINLQLRTKGVGTIDIKRSDNGNSYASYLQTGRAKSASLATTDGLTSNISITLPSVGSSTKKVLRLNASNQLEYSNDRVTYTLSSTSHILSSTAFVIPTSIFIWNNTFYGTSGAFRFENGYATYIYMSDLAAIGRNITVDLYNATTNAVLGTNTTTVSLAGTFTVRFQFTLPTADARLAFRASSTGINGKITLFAGSLDFGKW
jgi:hypothetical protein